MKLGGEYPTKLSGRRLYLPAPLLRQLQETELVINRGFERNLNLQAVAEWDYVINSLNKLAEKGRKEREFLRFYTRGASLLKIRNNYTEPILPDLLSYANIRSDALLIGMLNRIEVFSPEDFETILNNPPASFNDLVKEVMPEVELVPPPQIIVQEELIIPEHSKIITSYVNNIGFESILKDPKKILKLSPRDFEYFTAETLQLLGFEVELTKATVDGGVDIFAAQHTDLGSFLYCVECKHYLTQKVGVEVLRSVYGTVELKKANAGLIVTSNYFSRNAHKLQGELKHRIKLADFDRLKEWIDRINKQR